MSEKRKVEKEKTVTASVPKTILVFIIVSILNSPALLMSLFILAFNDSGDTFTVWSGFIQALNLMLIPLLYTSPLYLLVGIISQLSSRFFHAKTYYLILLLLYVMIFSIYWYVCAWLY